MWNKRHINILMIVGLSTIILWHNFTQSKKINKKNLLNYFHWWHKRLHIPISSLSDHNNENRKHFCSRVYLRSKIRQKKHKREVEWRTESIFMSMNHRIIFPWVNINTSKVHLILSICNKIQEMCNVLSIVALCIKSGTTKTLTSDNSVKAWTL